MDNGNLPNENKPEVGDIITFTFWRDHHKESINATIKNEPHYSIYEGKTLSGLIISEDPTNDLNCFYVMLPSNTLPTFPYMHSVNKKDIVNIIKPYNKFLEGV